MKRLILLFFVLFLPLQKAQSTIITGEIKYTEEITRNEVFAHSDKPANFEFIKKHFIDPNFAENQNNLSKGIKELANRKLAKFSDGSYGIIYYDDPEYSWYYSGNGRLLNFTKKSSLNYPCKTTKYKPDGSIANTGLIVSEQESFIFSADGILIAHWIGNFCYDSNNNIILTRKFVN